MAAGTLRNPDPVWCEGEVNGRRCPNLLGKIIDGTLVVAHRKRVVMMPLIERIVIRCECGWQWTSHGGKASLDSATAASSG